MYIIIKEYHNYLAIYYKESNMDYQELMIAAPIAVLYPFFFSKLADVYTKKQTSIACAINLPMIHRSNGTIHSINNAEKIKII